MFKKVIKPLSIVRSDRPRASDEKPHDGTSCTIFLEVLSNMALLQDSLTIPLNQRAVVVLGDSAWACDLVIENCLMTMGRGERCAITIDVSEINTSNEQDLPIEDTTEVVELKLELLDFDSTIPPIWKATHAQLMERASRLKAQGVDLFKCSKIAWAFSKFSKAIKLVIIASSWRDADIEQVEARKHLKLVLHLNVAACQLEFGNYDHVVSNCTQVLMVEGSNVKARWRRGTALSHLRDYERARADFQKVLSLEPGNKAAAKQVTILNQTIQGQDRKLGQALASMFN